MSNYLYTIVRLFKEEKSYIFKNIIMQGKPPYSFPEKGREGRWTIMLIS